MLHGVFHEVLRVEVGGGAGIGIGFLRGSFTPRPDGVGR